MFSYSLLYILKKSRFLKTNVFIFYLSTPISNRKKYAFKCFWFGGGGGVVLFILRS